MKRTPLKRTAPLDRASRPLERRCAYCGETMDPPPRPKAAAIYCSQTCGRRARHGRPLQSDRRCAWCARQLDDQRADAIYCCVKCRRDANRAKRPASAPYDLEPGYAVALLKDPCVYCGSTPTTFDHITAHSRGGADGWENLAPACAPCNSGKQARPLLTYLLMRVGR